MARFQPKLFVISAPSGAGKSSIISQILKLCPHFRLSVSYTTRPPRPGEQEGVHYHFVSIDEFLARNVEGDFLEWARVHGNYYGTSHSQIQQSFNQGYSVILDIDVQGALQLMELPNIQAHYIFISPPNMVELRQRLIGRGTETPESLQTRLQNAETEMGYQDRYEHIILNQDLPIATLELLELFLLYTEYHPGPQEPTMEQIRQALKESSAAQAILDKLAATPLLIEK